MARYFGAFIDDATVVDALNAAPWFFAEYQYLTITRLDSGPPHDVDVLPSLIDAGKNSWAPFSPYRSFDAVVVPGVMGSRILPTVDIFHEYDEIVLGNSALITNVSKFTSERYQADEHGDLPSDALRDFLANGVERAVSDGIGLNIIALDAESVARCAAAVETLLAKRTK